MTATYVTTTLLTQTMSKILDSDIYAPPIQILFSHKIVTSFRNNGHFIQTVWGLLAIHLRSSQLPPTLSIEKNLYVLWV